MDDKEEKDRLKKLILNGLLVIIVFTMVWTVNVLVLSKFDTEMYKYCEEKNLTCFENCTDANVICGGDLCVICRYNKTEMARLLYQSNSTY